MKQCPTCNRTYADDTQSFCLEDGTQLTIAYDSAATQVINPSHSHEVMPQVKTLVSPSPPRRVNPALYLAIAVVALLVGGGVVALLMSRNNSSSNVEPPDSKSNVSESSASQLSTPNPSETAATPLPQNSQPSPSTGKRLPPPSSGTWFVILGSYPRDQYEKAAQRLQTVQGLGYEASIIDTDNYRGFRGGLWAVVMGPYSKSHAKNVAAQMKSVRPDAYAKSGW